MLNQKDKRRAWYNAVEQAPRVDLKIAPVMPIALDLGDRANG